MSLDLDERQRAILQEIGVCVWLPEVVAHVSSVDATENVASSAISTGATALKHLKSQLHENNVASPPGPAQGIAEMDWLSLAQTIATCQACQLCTGRRSPVFGAAGASCQADWLVVGEPPDDVEERMGAPFAGPSGQLLDNMLKALGVSRCGTERGAAVTSAATAATTAYLTNVVKCRPAVVRNPALQELATCENYLRREVALVQPKVILAMGRFAAQTLLQGSLPDMASTPLGKLRGKIYRYQGIPVVVTYHPVYLLRTQQDKARAWADLCLALDVMQRGE